MAATSPTTLALALAAALVAGACDHVERDTSNPAQAAWMRADDAMAKRLVDLRQRQAMVGSRARAIAVPEGTEDATLSDTLSDIAGRLAVIDAQCDAAENARVQARAEVEALLTQPDRRAIETAIAAGESNFATAVANADSALSELEPRVATGEAIMKRLLEGIRVEVERLTKIARQGGSLDFSDIDFQVGSAQFDFTRPVSKATLGRLVQFGQSCPELRFAISGHTSKEGTVAGNRALSLARAEAVKTYLTGAGVAPEKIVRTVGLGSTQPLADEPEPGSPAEAAMPRPTLEAARRTNRRVNVEVVTPCAGAEAQVAPSAPAATITPNDPHAGHGH